jgi:hypothetical protein
MGVPVKGTFAAFVMSCGALIIWTCKGRFRDCWQRFKEYRSAPKATGFRDP